MANIEINESGRKHFLEKVQAPLEDTPKPSLLEGTELTRQTGSMTRELHAISLEPARCAPAAGRP